MTRPFAAVLLSLSLVLPASAQSAAANVPVSGDVQLTGAGLHTQTFARILTKSVLADWPATRAQLCAEVKAEIENPRNYPATIATPAGNIPMTVQPRITSCTIGPAIVATGRVDGDSIRIIYDVAGNSLAGKADGVVGPMAMVPPQAAGADYTATFDVDVVVTAAIPPVGQPLEIHSVIAGWHNVKPTLTLRGSPLVTTILNPLLPNAEASIEKSRLKLPQLIQRVTPSLAALDAALIKVSARTYGYYQVAFSGDAAKTLVFTAVKGTPPAAPGR